MNTEAEFEQIQNELRDKIVLTDTFDPAELRTIAGVDLAYWNAPDGTEQIIILGNGAYRMSAEELRLEIAEAVRQMREHLQS